jgi:predicted permease
MNWLRKIKTLFARGRMEREMAEELRLHLEMEAERRRKAGRADPEARAEAARAFGNIASIQERAREQTGWPRLENLGRDFRQAARRLWQSPGFTLIAIITLALGIGANTAIYSIVRGVVQRPLRASEPDRLMAVMETNPHNGGRPFSVSVRNFADWRERARSFEVLAAVAHHGASLAGMGEPLQVSARHVSRGYLAMLGTPPLLGRDFRDEEDQPGANRVALLNETFWRANFGADPGMVGRTLMIGGVPHEIVGVARTGPEIGGPAELIIPLGADLAKGERDNHEVEVVGRLRAGVTPAQAEAEMAAIAAQLGREHPVSNAGWGVRMQPLHDALVPASVRKALYVLLGAVALLLLNASANLASMQLARAVARDRETAVCAALGGTRGRLVTRQLAEGALLAAVGGVLGVGLALWLMDLWKGSWLAAGVPRADEVALDGAVLAAAAGAALLSCLVGGLAPAWRAHRVDVRTALQAAGRSSTGARRRGLQWFVAAQVALSFTLLCASGLLLNSWGKLLRADLGFSPENTLTFRVAPTARAQEFFTGLVERLRALPGVQAVGVASGIPLSGMNTSVNVAAVGPSRLPAGKSLQAEWRLVRDDQLGALRQPLRRGRAFTPADGEGAPKVVMVNEALARALWGDEDPIGRQLDVGADGGTPATVVGLVGDLRNVSPAKAPEPAFYLSGYLWLWAHMTVAVRADGEPERLLPQIRAEVRALDPAVPVHQVRTLEQQVDENLGEARMLATLVGAFGLLALLMAGLGVAGVTAFSVASRTREIGIRVALGASGGQVLGMVLRENARLFAWGTGAGLALFAATAQPLAGQLYETGRWEAWAVLPAVAALALVGLAAGWIPARKVTRVDPVTALRAE